MAFYSQKKRFSFASSAPSLDSDAFAVIRFKGIEGISMPYEFDIMLVSDNPEIDLDQMLEMPATFTIHRDSGEDVDFHGILSEFVQLHSFNNYYFYRAHLVPRLWWLGISRHNQVFLNKTAPQIIELALKEAQFTSLDYEFKLQRAENSAEKGSYLHKEFVCQYNESHFNFISRWLEREGIYYYFDQHGSAEKIIFSDTQIAHTDFHIAGDVRYAPPSGMVDQDKTEYIHSFVCRQRQTPQSVFLKDYDYNRPSLPIEGQADVNEKGHGVDYRYGDNFSTSDDGNQLAKVQAQALACRKREYSGESTVPFMAPGYTFNLHGHFRNGFNRKYLVESVSHEGDQSGSLLSDILRGLSGNPVVYYRNNFSAIESDVQYRPLRKAMTPRISGSLNAVIDAEGSGEFAEIDDRGRYKVRLPFDINDEHLSGKASCYLRMLQPYAGADYGMHFPLHKGTEVLLTFIDGDPDRPVIAGSVANEGTISPVTSANQTKSVLRDNYGNELVFDATPGDEHIELYSPHHQSGLTLGRSVDSFTDSDKHEWTIGNTIQATIGSDVNALLGFAADIKAGFTLDITGGVNLSAQLGGKYSFNADYDISKTLGPIVNKADGDMLNRSKKDNIMAAGDQICLLGGADKDKEGRSIIGVNPGDIILSTGSKVDGKAERDENWGPYFKSFFMNEVIDKRFELTDEIYSVNPERFPAITMMVLSTISVVLLTLASEFGAGTARDVLASFSGATAIVPILCGVHTLIKELSDSSIEPVTHPYPAAKIQLIGEGSRNLDTEIIHLETRMSSAAQGSYNDLLSSQIQMSRFGEVTIKSPGDGIDSGQEITLTTGEFNKEVRLSLNSKTADRAKLSANVTRTESSAICIHQNGDVEIAAKYADANTFKSKVTLSQSGAITITGKGGDIDLDAGKDQQVKIKSNSFFSGDVLHKNFKVLS